MRNKMRKNRTKLLFLALALSAGTVLNANDQDV